MISWVRDTSSGRSAAEENGAWIAHVPKVQETLSTYKQPKAFITQSRFGPPLPIVQVSMIFWKNKIHLTSGVCRRVSMCHRRDISDFPHCVLDCTNQIFSESTWYHYPLTNLPLTHHPPWPTRPQKTQTWTFLHFMTFYTKQTINFLKACDTYYPLWP